MKSKPSGEITYEQKIWQSSDYALRESSAHFSQNDAVFRALDLTLEFGQKLDPSVRAEYERLWHTVNDNVDPYDEEQVLKLTGARDGSSTETV